MSEGPKVKICCISSIKEARLAIQNGASAIGLVGDMPSGPGVISEELIHEIAKSVQPLTETFLLTSEQTAEGIINHHRRTQTSTIQIVDSIISHEYAKIRKALPAVKLVQVVHVIDKSSVDEAVSVSKWVDAILLDTGNPNLKVKVLGGTGTVHDWTLSRQIREKANKPVWLAGGIKAKNVKQAIEAVQPYGVDLCGSVRTDDRLDEKKLIKFFEMLR